MLPAVINSTLCAAAFGSFTWALFVSPLTASLFLPVLRLIRRRLSASSSQSALDEETYGLLPSTNTPLQLPPYAPFRVEHGLRLGTIVGRLSGPGISEESPETSELMREAASLLHVSPSRVSIASLQDLETRVREQLLPEAVAAVRSLTFLNVGFVLASIGVALTAWPTLRQLGNLMPWLYPVITYTAPAVLTYAAAHLVALPKLAPELVAPTLARPLVVLGALLAAGTGLVGIARAYDDNTLSQEEEAGRVRHFFTVVLMHAVAWVPMAWIYRLELLGVGAAGGIFYGILNLWVEPLLRWVGVTGKWPGRAWDLLLASLVMVALKLALCLAAQWGLVDDSAPKHHVGVLDIGLNIFGRIALNIWMLAEVGLAGMPKSQWVWNLVYVAFLLGQTAWGSFRRERGLFVTSVTFLVIWICWEITRWIDINEVFVFISCVAVLILLGFLRKHPHLVNAYAHGIFRS